MRRTAVHAARTRCRLNHITFLQLQEQQALLLVQELPLKTAVRLAAEITGASRNVLYDTALAWKRSGASGEDEDEAGDAGS